MLQLPARRTGSHETSAARYPRGSLPGRAAASAGAVQAGNTSRRSAAASHPSRWLALTSPAPSRAALRSQRRVRSGELAAASDAADSEMRSKAAGAHTVHCNHNIMPLVALIASSLLSTSTCLVAASLEP